MKLFITDHADQSVGMFPCTWEVEVPFIVDESMINRHLAADDYSAELTIFKNDIRDLYSDYCDGRCEAYYEFEITKDL